MTVLYLRFLIGGAAVVFVTLVAVATLGLSVTIAFRTLRDNAEQSVVRLGTATAVTTDAFFADPELRLKTLASLPRWSPEGTTTPSDDPAFAPGHGGPTFDKWRRGIVSFAVEAQFTDLVDVVLTDGTACRAFLFTTLTPSKYITHCAVPTIANAAATTLQTSAHDVPTGDFNPTMTAAVRPFIANVALPTLKSPATAALWANWIGSTPPRTTRWIAPVGVSSLGVDHFVVSAVARISNATQDIGFVGVHRRLEAVGSILTAAKLTANTELFVYDQDQFLVGASSNLTIFTTENFTGTDATPGCTTTADSRAIYPSDTPRRLCRHHITTASYRPLAGSSRAAPSFFSSASTTGRVRLIKGSYVYTQRLPTLTGDQRLFIASVTPEEDMLGDAEKILPLTAGVTAGIVALVAVVSFVLVWLVLRPLHVIAERMGKAARLERDDAEVAISPIAEIGDLQRAFVEMRDELGRIRAFVPQALLRISSSDDEDHSPLGPEEGSLSSVAPSRPVSYQVSKSMTHSTSDQQLSRAASSETSSPRSSYVTSHHAVITPTRAGRKKLNHMAGTRREAVAVLCVNLRGFHAATERGLDGEKMAAVVDAVLAAAHQEKGVVDSFHGDRFMVTFNAAKPCANHGIRATLTAARIAAVLERTSATPRAHNTAPYNLPVTCGVAVGTAQVGNVGSAAMKSFTVVGPVVSQAAILERMCKLYAGAQCLVPQRLFADLTTAARLRTVDYVQLPFARKPCLVADVLGEHQSGGDDEWMYQLHAQEHKRSLHADGQPVVDCVHLCNTAWAMLIEGRGREAVAAFDEVPEDHVFEEEQRVFHPHSHRRGSAVGAVVPMTPLPAPSERLSAVIGSVRDAFSVSGSTTPSHPATAKARVTPRCMEVQQEGPCVAPRDLGCFYKTVTDTW